MVKSKYAMIDKQVIKLKDYVLDTLRGITNKVEEINYPDFYKGGRRSIDIVADTRYKSLVIKVQSDTKKVSKEEIEDLVKSSKILNALPIIVSKYSAGEELEDYVVYIKNNVFVMNEKTLKGVIKDKDTYVFNIKGNYLVKINGKKLRNIREKRKLSLGDVANALGVSRKTIYEYERESFAATVETAEKLINIFGEDIVEPLNIEILSELQAMYKISLKVWQGLEHEIVSYLKQIGLNALSINFSAPDVLASDEVNEEMKLFIVDLRRKIKNITSKLHECIKFSKVLSGEVLILSKDKEKSKIRTTIKELKDDNIRIVRDSEIPKLRKILKT